MGVQNSNNGGAAQASKRAPAKATPKENGTANSNKRKQPHQSPIEAESMPNAIIVLSKPNQEMVDILVGAEGHLFRIHKDAICHYSSYFRDAFTSQTVEAESNSMKLPSINDKVFSLFVNYVYTQEVEHDDYKIPELMDLAHLWTCATQWKVPSLQNKVMAMLMPIIDVKDKQDTELKRAELVDFVMHAYSIGRESPLRKLAAVKMVSFVPQDEFLNEWIKDYPEDMLMDLTQALVGHVQTLPYTHLRSLDLKKFNFEVNDDE